MGYPVQFMQPIQLLIYRDWQGLNMGNNWWKNHDSATMHTIDYYFPWLHFLDVDTNPTIQNVYASDPGVDGSRFEYNNLAKTQIKLSFYFEFPTYKLYLDKKHDVQEFFAAKAGFIIGTSYHPNLHACGYCSKVDIKPTSEHIAVFDVILDNALGMWYSESTQFLEKHWDERLIYRDLRLPTDLGDDHTWKLHAGHNRVFIAGDVMMQMTNPIMQMDIHVKGCSNEVTIFNKTSNTTLSAKDKSSLPDMTWHNLDLRADGSNQPLNDKTNSLDFWLDPGWNDIQLTGANEAVLDTRFYFTNL